ANSCTGASKTFTITVNPTPDVATIANQVICNGALTSAVIYSGTVVGTSYSWANNNTTIGLGASGIGNISAFTATNTTNAPVIGTIVYTPTANACVGLSKSFTITVNPTPTISPVSDQAICNGAATIPINFTGSVNGTSYSWINSNTTIGLAGFGMGNIASFTAINTTSSAIVATISVVPLANGCTGATSTFTITVNPTPVAPIISLTTPPSVCDMTYFRNFGAATLPPTGINYSWSTINAAVSDTGKTQQYVLINFKNPGTATVILTATDINTGCLNRATHDVNVTSNVADVPAKVIYFTKSFVVLQNNEEAYSWGYDDSYTLAPTLIPGELNQDYVNANPDFANHNYWAMVTHDGCIQKTYYNKPTDAVLKPARTEVIVTPNPASQQVNIAINTSLSGDIQMDIVDMKGQKVYAATVIGNNATVDISSLPVGIYIIACYNNHERISFTRFMKN
ncbi:MAG: T9SS type A sorting domain-containing protein, partial [Chitinophagaceae bacterium]